MSAGPAASPPVVRTAQDGTGSAPVAVCMHLRTRSSAAASVFMQPNGDQFIDFLFRHDQPGWSGRGPTVNFRLTLVCRR